MDQLITQNTQLPSTIEDLSQFILIGREQLKLVQAAIKSIDRLKMADGVRKQKLQEAQMMAEVLLDAEAQFGKLMSEVPKSSGGDRRSKNFKMDSGVHFEKPDPWEMAEQIENGTFVEPPKTKKEVIEENGFDVRQVNRFEQLAKHPEIVAQAKAEAKENESIVSRTDVLKKIKLEEKKQEITEAEKSIHEQAEEKYKPVLYIGDGIGYCPPEKYDLLLTDPPYSTDIDDIEAFVDTWLYNALDNVKDTGFAYVFIGAYPDEVKAYLNAKTPDHITLCQQLIWTYKNTLGNNPKDRYKQNYQVCLFYRGVNAPVLDCPLTNEQWAVQEINAPDGRQGDRYHAWQKPMEIAERFVRHSTKQDMTVFDPFACTGTFLLAATKLGRRAYGFEINPEHAEIAFSRGCVKG